jgi:anaerobic magnesium-protoporphyrin IX monomethyl ester cyclase
MKVVLMHPRFEVDSNIPLGIAYIAAFLSKHGIETDVIDRTFAGREGWEDDLKSRKPDILGLSVSSTNFEDAMAMLALVRRTAPHVKVVFGGPQATVLGERCYEFCAPDAVVIGEGEITMLELVEAFAKGTTLADVKGIVYKEDGQVETTGSRPYIEDLDLLPFPAREKFPLEHYLSSAHGRISWAVESPAVTILSSRGCPFKCTYCSSYRQLGRKVRFRSVENILAEVDYLVKNYGIKGLYFWDDTFVLDKKRVMAVCEGIKKYGITWYCQSRVDTCDEEMLRALKGAGCRTLSFGIESGSQRILDNYLKKGITLEQTRKAVGLAKKLGFIVHGSFMLGIPGETREDMEKTIQFAKELDPDAVEFNITTPYYGTELREIVQREGKLLTDRLFGLNVKEKSIFTTRDLSPELVSAMYKRAVRRFYFRPRYIFKQICSLRSWGDLRNKVRGVAILAQNLKWGN